MALQIASLNSGSNGNCYYVGNDTDAVLIDIGISCRETELRMKQMGLSLKKVKAIFISHEHGDHIKGVSTLANKYNIPVYITDATAKNGPRLIKHLSKTFIAKQPITIASIVVTAFCKQHDAVDPHSFIVSSNHTTVGIFTDIGTVCNEVSYYFKQCHAVFLEANYDDEMLEKGGYPQYLKNRIKGNQGHLSNKQAVDLFIQHRPHFMSNIILSHLSKDNNSPTVAAELFTKHAGNVKIHIASRHCASALLNIYSDSLIKVNGR